MVYVAGGELRLCEEGGRRQWVKRLRTSGSDKLRDAPALITGIHSREVDGSYVYIVEPKGCTTEWGERAAWCSTGSWGDTRGAQRGGWGSPAQLDEDEESQTALPELSEKIAEEHLKLWADAQRERKEEGESVQRGPRRLRTPQLDRTERHPEPETPHGIMESLSARFAARSLRTWICTTENCSARSSGERCDRCKAWWCRQQGCMGYNRATDSVCHMCGSWWCDVDVEKEDGEGTRKCETQNRPDGNRCKTCGVRGKRGWVCERTRGGARAAALRPEWAGAKCGYFNTAGRLTCKQCGEQPDDRAWWCRNSDCRVLNVRRGGEEDTRCRGCQRAHRPNRAQSSKKWFMEFGIEEAAAQADAQAARIRTEGQSLCRAGRGAAWEAAIQQQPRYTRQPTYVVRATETGATGGHWSEDDDATDAHLAAQARADLGRIAEDMSEEERARQVVSHGSVDIDPILKGVQSRFTVWWHQHCKWKEWHYPEGSFVYVNKVRPVEHRDEDERIPNRRLCRVEEARWETTGGGRWIYRLQEPVVTWDSERGRYAQSTDQGERMWQPMGEFGGAALEPEDESIAVTEGLVTDDEWDTARRRARIAEARGWYHMIVADNDAQWREDGDSGDDHVEQLLWQIHSGSQDRSAMFAGPWIWGQLQYTSYMNPMALVHAAIAVSRPGAADPGGPSEDFLLEELVNIHRRSDEEGGSNTATRSSLWAHQTNFLIRTLGPARLLVGWLMHVGETEERRNHSPRRTFGAAENTMDAAGRTLGGAQVSNWRAVMALDEDNERHAMALFLHMWMELETPTERRTVWSSRWAAPLNRIEACGWWCPNAECDETSISRSEEKCPRCGTVASHFSQYSGNSQQY